MSPYLSGFDVLMGFLFSCLKYKLSPSILPILFSLCLATGLGSIARAAYRTFLEATGAVVVFNRLACVLWSLFFSILLFGKFYRALPLGMGFTATHAVVIAIALDRLEAIGRPLNYRVKLHKVLDCLLTTHRFAGQPPDLTAKQKHTIKFHR